MSEPVLKYLDSAITQLRDIRTKWPNRIDKQLKRIECLYNELIVNHPSADADKAELSVTGQVLLENLLSETKQLFDDLSNEHRQVHSSISRCGKEIDRNFHSDTSGIIKNQKDIEKDPVNRERVNKLIFDYLNSVGKVDVAECLRKETGMSSVQSINTDEVRTIMESYRNGDYQPAIEWVGTNHPDETRLLFDLHQQHVMQLLENGDKNAALTYVRKRMQLTDQSNSRPFSFLLGAIVSPADVPRYAVLRQAAVTLEVEHNLARLLSGTFSHLSEILDMGIRTVPSLIRLRGMMAARQDQIFFADELPVEISLDKHVHSTFTCPILKIQSTDNNPPMRLACGHVISRDALNKLAQNSRFRQIRLKCPYCPMESSASDAKRVFF